MPHYNKSIFVGHVGQDAKMMTSQDGTKSWASFTLAVSVGTIAKPETMWVKCSVWTRPERALEKVKKGDSVLVEGKLKCSAYERKQDGKAQADVSLYVTDWQLLKSSTKAEALDEPIVFASTVPGGEFDNIPF